MINRQLIKLFIITMFLAGETVMAGDYEEAEVYSGLRKQALTLTVEQLDTDSPVLAVLIETGYPEAVVTLISVADGSSSLYFSNGGGIIGAGEYEQVNDSSLRLVNLADNFKNNLMLTNTYPLPKNGYTRFYVVTTSGVLTEEVLEDDLGNERHALSHLFFQGHELITYIRAADEHRSTGQNIPDDG